MEDYKMLHELNIEDGFIKEDKRRDKKILFKYEIKDIKNKKSFYKSYIEIAVRNIIKSSHVSFKLNSIYNWFNNNEIKIENKYEIELIINDLDRRGIVNAKIAEVNILGKMIQLYNEKNL